MSATTFSIVGGGWRTQFFLRVAKALPHLFSVKGMLVRDPDKGHALEKQWDVPTYRHLNELCKVKTDFCLLSVPWPVTPGFIYELVERNIPVLTETPPAPDIPALEKLNLTLNKGCKVQVAEQYPFQPDLAAAIQVAESGLIGKPSQAQVSIAHGYHGIALLRRLLGIEFEKTEITACTFESPIVEGPTREGNPTSEKIKISKQTLATFQFGEKLGIFDFTPDQYRSWIRSRRLLVRGDRGEIQNDTVRYLKDFRTPIQTRFVRESDGDRLKGIRLGDQWIYSHSYSASLSDDEIAVATVLERMADYLSGGKEFYGFAEASYDHYLGLMIGKAAESGQRITVDLPSWISRASE